LECLFIFLLTIKVLTDSSECLYLAVEILSDDLVNNVSLSSRFVTVFWFILYEHCIYTNNGLK